MKIAITGASGYLAWELIRQLKEFDDFDIIAVTSSPTSIVDDDNYRGTAVMDNDSFFQSDMSSVDVIVHTAFCRKSVGQGLVKSLEFSKAVFEKAIDEKIGAIINLSSQSVYGSAKEYLPNEDGVIAPGYLYALSKASSEILLDSIISKRSNITSYVNLRLASLIGPSKSFPNNVLLKFIESALSGDSITIKGGKQRFSFIDVRDAATAIIKLIRYPHEKWACVYNLGPKQQCTIIELAHMAIESAAKLGHRRVQMSVIDDDIFLNAGMDSNKIYNTLDWTPKYTIQDSVSITSDYIYYHQYNNKEES